MSSDRSKLAQIYFYLTGFAPTHFDHKNTEVPEHHEEDKTCDVLGMSGTNNNSLATVTEKMVAVASSINEASAAREDRSGTHATVKATDPYLNSTDLTSADFGPCLKENAKRLKNVEDETSAVSIGNFAGTTASPETDVFTTKELLATKESSPTLEKAQNVPDTAAKKHEGNCNTSPSDEKVPTEPSSQRSRTDVGDHQDVSEVVCKCE